MPAERRPGGAVPAQRRPPGTGPAGWRLSTAEEFYFLAHERDRPLIHPRALGAGCAAGILVEALLTRWLVVLDGLVTVVDQRPGSPTGGGSAADPGPLVRWGWDWVAAEPHRHPVGSWLRVLSQDATAQVVASLADAGYLAERGGWRGRRWCATNGAAAAWPAARLDSLLGKQSALTATDAALIAIVDATGVGRATFRYATPVVGERIRTVLTLLPPDLGAIVAETRQLIDAAALTRR